MQKSPFLTPRISFWATAVLTIFVALISRWQWSETGIWNDGVAFSLPIPTWVIYVVSAGTLVALVLWASALDLGRKLRGIGLGLIVGGGIANLADRLANQGRVWDYIPFFGIGYFNLSDVAVILGLAITIYYAWMRDERG